MSHRPVIYKIEQSQSVSVEVQTEEQENQIKELNREFERTERRNRRIQSKTDSLESMNEETGFELADDSLNPEKLYEQKEMKDAVAKAMSGLTQRQKNVVYKTFWEQKTLREIGEELGINNKTVHEILKAAKSKLKKYLRNFAPAKHNSNVH